MTIYIDTYIDPDQVFLDFTALTGGAGALGEINVESVTGSSGYTDLYRLTYELPGSSDICQRIKALVDHPTGNVVVSAVPSSFTLPDGNLITQRAGETFEDTTSKGEPVIRVAYDVGMCNGNGYWADGQDGHRISIPRAIILYHELSHAWHFANATVMESEEAEEQAAETDENTARHEKGEPLRLTTSHNGGCGKPTSGTYGNPWENKCFIVAAAAGTESGAALDSLRLVRDASIRSLPLGHRLFDDLYGEYYSYSPRIAKHLWADSHLREAYRQAVVGPLLRVYAALVECLAQWPDLDAIDAVLQHAMAQEAQTQNVQHDELSAALVDSLRSGLPNSDIIGTDLFAQECLVLSQWAIVRPLRTYWNIILNDRAPTARAVRVKVFQWLSEQLTDPSVLCAAHESAKDLATRRGQERSTWQS